MKSARYFPVEPLEQLAKVAAGLPGWRLWNSPWDASWNDGSFARVVGVTRRTVLRWRARGLSPAQADRAAVALGFHPAEVWTDWYSEVAS